MTTELKARALLLAERLDLRAFESSEQLAISPLTIAVGSRGRAVLFRFGAVVLFAVDAAEEAAFLQQISPFRVEPLDRPEVESLPLRISSDEPEAFVKGELVLRSPSVQRLQLVADVLAKSSVLSLYESRVGATFDRIEPLAETMRRGGRGARRARELIRHIGATLLIEQRMVARAEIIEKPELLWEYPELEPLFLRLEDEFELKERNHALERKLDLVARTAQTLLNLLQADRSLRVEWYITILIVVEIVLTSYEMFFRGGLH